MMWWWLLTLSTVAGINWWLGYRYGASKLREVRLERDNAVQTLDGLGVPVRRSPRAPRHNDGRSDVRKVRWGTQRNWRR
jgi:hypothetical protein